MNFTLVFIEKLNNILSLILSLFSFFSFLILTAAGFGSQITSLSFSVSTRVHQCAPDEGEWYHSATWRGGFICHGSQGHC